MGTQALEDGLFAKLLILDYLYVFRYFCVGKGKEGKGRKGKGKGKEKGREKGRQNGRRKARENERTSSVGFASPVVFWNIVEFVKTIIFYVSFSEPPLLLRLH